MLDRLNALGARLLLLARWMMRILLWLPAALWRFMRRLPRRLWRFVRWAPGAFGRALRWLVRAPIRLLRWLIRLLATLVGSLLGRLAELWRWSVDAIRHRRWRRLLALSLALMVTAALLAGAVLFLRGRGARTAQVFPAVAALTIRTVATVAAGAPLTVTVAAQPPVTGTLVILTSQGTLGLATQAQPLQEGIAIFNLNATQTSGAGAMALTATAGAAEARTSVTVLPGRAADPLLTVAGPRSVMVGGEEAMVVALPLDSFGNAVADGTLVNIQAQHPPAPGQLLGAVDSFIQGTRNLLTAVRVRSRAVAGPLRLAAFGGDAHSLAQTVRVQPAQPMTVTVRATPSQAPADGESAIHLATSRLTDRFGNQLLDGVLVTFLVESSDGTRRWLPATVVDGVATTLLPAPTAPATQTVRAWVAGVLSQPIPVTFRTGAAVQPFALVAEHSGDATVITAGPILGELNQLAPDDSAVTFTLYRQGDALKSVVGRTVYGYAAVSIYDGELPAGDYTATAALGTTQVSIPVSLPAPADGVGEAAEGAP